MCNVRKQFIFKKIMVTREGLYKDQQVDLFRCFIDFEQAFNWEKHNALIETLNDIGIDKEVNQTIEAIYWHHIAMIKIKGNTAIELQPAVRQGSVLSPNLFNVCCKLISANSWSYSLEGIEKNDQSVHKIPCADKTVLMTFWIRTAIQIP